MFHSCWCHVVQSEDRENQSDQLQSLIAGFQRADSRGEEIDRDQLVKEHPQLADSLLAFFASHDKTKAEDTPTLLGGQIPTAQPAAAAEERWRRPRLCRARSHADRPLRRARAVLRPALPG